MRVPNRPNNTGESPGAVIQARKSSGLFDFGAALKNPSPIRCLGLNPGSLPESSFQSTCTLGGTWEAGGSSHWFSATHVGDLDSVLSSQLQSNLAPAIVGIWESKQVDEKSVLISLSFK